MGGVKNNFKPQLTLRPNDPGITFGRLVTTFERTIAHIASLADLRFLPKERAHVQHLAFLGAKYMTLGIPHRSRYPRQPEVWQAMQKYFLSRSLLIIGTQLDFPGYLDDTDIPHYQQHEAKKKCSLQPHRSPMTTWEGRQFWMPKM